jgi:hypothetical protein
MSTDWILDYLPRLVVTIVGTVTLAAAAVLVAVSAWDRIDRWLRARTPRRVRQGRVYSLDEQGLVTLAADRAALMAAVGAAERMWTFSPAPGVDVLIVRDQPGDEEGRAVTTAVRTAVRKALTGLKLPQRGHS